MSKQPTLEISDKDTNAVVKLQQGYVLALLFIIVMTIFSHHLTSKVIEQEIIGAEVATNISRQITDISQIGRTALAYYNEPEPLDLTFLENSINGMSTALAHIGSYIDSPKEATKAKIDLQKSMRDSLLLEKRLYGFIDDAKTYLTLSRQIRATDPEQAQREILAIQRSLKKISDKPNQELIKLLQIALADHQENQLSEIKNLHEMQSFLTYGIVIIILLEALFIFRPLVRRVDATQKNLMRLALEDTLTGLKNRRAFHKDFDNYEKHLQRKKERFVVAICDLDKFKSVNDTYGHDVGDMVLKHFSIILARTLRPTDIVARMGGEEFAILLTNTSEATAFKVLDRVREIVEKNPCPITTKKGNSKLPFTTSIGFAEGPLPGRKINVDEFFKYADIALYKAKEEGRNRVINGTPPRSPKSSTPQSSELDADQSENHPISKNMSESKS